MKEHHGIGKACRVENAFDVIRRSKDDVLLFVDPPYLQEQATGQYAAGDFTMDEHIRLARALRNKHYVLTHRYDNSLASLYRNQGAIVIRGDAIMSISKRGASRHEMLVLNPKRVRKQ